jgi:hypothetical protein
MSSDHHSGGCQCGAVRFHVDGALGDASVCHCRMCQKAFGGLYAPLVSLKSAKLTWTRGAPANFQSSNYVKRGFCSKCGTPLTYEAPDGTALAIGAFDHPAEIKPKIQWGLEGKIDYVDRICALPEKHTLANTNEAPFLETIVSYQHPDHDTDSWPPKT